MRIDVHIHSDAPEDDRRLHRIVVAAVAEALRETHMSQITDDLKAVAQNLTTVKDSLLAFITTSMDKIAALAVDNQAVQDATAEVKADAQAISDAIVANTPAAPPTP